MSEQFILQYAKKFGKDLQEIHQYLVEEQESLGQMFAKSEMPKLKFQSEALEEDKVDAAYKLWNDDF